MASVYEVARKQRYRVTLDMEVLGDFDPHQIDWNKLFELKGENIVVLILRILILCGDR